MYFLVERLVTIIVDNLYDVIVVYLYICMHISLVKFQVGLCINKEEELD